MAGPLFFDRVQETSTTIGTGPYTLGGATVGFQSWSVVGNANTAYYMATDGVDWEVGLGTYASSGTTLARTTVLTSSNANAAVNWAAGTRTISQVDPALFSNGLVTSATAFGPNANDGKALGTGALSWSDLFLAAGGVINWANGDVAITQSTNLLAFSGASSGYTFDAVVGPSANDGAALGASGAAWSDLFLAAGGVINWGAGDVTITEAANALAFAGASNGYSFDAQVTGVTAGAGDNSTKLATTAYVETALAGAGGQPIPTSSTLPVGMAFTMNNATGSTIASGATVAGTGLRVLSTTGATQTGSWMNIQGAAINTGQSIAMVRTS